MNAPKAGDRVYLVRHMGLAFDVVEVRAGKRYPYVLQHPDSRERMAFSLADLAPLEGTAYDVGPAPEMPTGRRVAGGRCDHRWFRKSLNKFRRVERQACAVVGCVQKRNLPMVDCPACVVRLDDEHREPLNAEQLIARRDACKICSDDGLIPAPKECRCCGSRSMLKGAFCGPCFGAHGYRSVVICTIATPDEVRHDELMRTITVNTSRASKEGRRKAEALG